MKRVCAFLLSAVMVSALAGCGAKPSDDPEASATEPQTTQTQTTQAETIAADVNDRLDKALTDARFEGIVQISKGGSVIYQYAQGDDDNGKPLTIDASMPIGSVSKQFCAACILFLCEQNVLSVEDTLDKYYPDYKHGKELTVKNLLNMSSGLRNYLELVEPSMFGEDEWENTTAITKTIFEQEFRFEPGKDYEYSNSNYFLLAQIVEKASGIAYHKFLREQFFEPLGMTHTGFVEEIAKDTAWASALSAEELKKDYFYLPGLTKGAGDVVSNAEDMDKWMRGLSGGKILSAEGFRQMTENVNPNSAEEYGYGLWHMTYGGVGHVGQIPPSFGAVDYLNTERDVYLFAVFDTGRGMSTVQDIPQTLLSVLLEQ